MGKDVSKTTIMILLILTILVSILGTWTVMTSITEGPEVVVSDNPVGDARVSLNIIEPPEPAKGEVNIEITS